MPGKKLLLEKGRSGKVGFNHRPTRGLREQSRRASGTRVPDIAGAETHGPGGRRVVGKGERNRRPAEREMERGTKARQREYRAPWAMLRACVLVTWRAVLQAWHCCPVEKEQRRGVSV